MSIEYALVQQGDIPRAFEIETAGFHPDEAAELASLEYRQEHASLYFLGAYSTASPRTLLGYVCSTLTSSSVLTHDSMSIHDPSGSYVAIHSVCVDKGHQGKGIASGLLKEYLRRLAEMSEKEGQVKGARLIAHEELIPLYQRAGFELVGPSKVEHGPRPWFELKVDFPSSSSSAAEPSSSSTVASTSTSAPVEGEDEGPNVRSPGLPLSRFTDFDILVDPSTNLNAADLYCPRPECRCLLLRRGTGKWVRSHPADFALPDLPRPVSAAAPSPSPSRGYWSVSSPLAFENIGFSRNAAPPSSTSSPSAPPPAAGAGAAGATIKYLTCADCDHGPLGWHDTEGRDLGMEVQAENEAREGQGEKGEKGGEVRKGREFLLAVERVRYKV
ncbi:hypothetical protein JCM8097_001682 [Rhodosporidiobolus ruineniae]